jgi:putative hydroxymethylpyrimidine transport system ATP-binding protein
MMMVNKISIEMANVSLEYRDSSTPVIQNLNMSIRSGQWTALLGKSGCGKTSILRYLAGLLDDKINFEGRLDIHGISTLENNVAYMAQQDLLFPWLNVLDNICLSSHLSSSQFLKHKITEDEKEKAIELLTLVGLEGEAYKMPSQLSGGMRQRVALARTLMQDKALVLMDEPFSALDAVTRHRLQDLAAQLLVDKTVLLITHDPQEALRLSHCVYILQGKPAHAISLELPESVIPRKFDVKLAELQEEIIHSLEADYA